jgi:hypothetical protein
VAQLPCASNIAAHYATAELRQVLVGHFPSSASRLAIVPKLIGSGAIRYNSRPALSHHGSLNVQFDERQHHCP